MKSYKSIKTELLKDTHVKAAYEALGPEFKLVETFIDYRIKCGLTQAELAEKVGTKQSAISRFESGSYNPTIHFLYKIARALRVQLKITVSK